MEKSLRLLRLSLLFFILLLSIAIYSDRLMEFFDKQPIEPIASGDFPAAPTWVFSTENDIVSSPRGIDQTIFARTNNSLYSIDVSKKAIKWKRASANNQELVIPPLIVDPLVIVEENGSSLAAYSIDTGELVWKTPEVEIATVNNITASIESLAFNQLHVYAARFDWNLTAYDRKTGESIWEHDLPGRTDPYAAANEKIVALAADDFVYVLDGTTGAVLWQIDTLGYAGPILLSGTQLFVTDEKNTTLTSISLETYEIEWVANYSSTIEDFEYTCLGEAGQNLLIAADKLIMVSKIDGGIIWASESMGTLECPVILENNLYVRNTENDLFLMELTSGNVRGKLLVQEDTILQHAHFRNPVALGNRLIVPFGDNRLLIYE
jgi:hypothetical protein